MSLRQYRYMCQIWFFVISRYVTINASTVLILLGRQTLMVMAQANVFTIGVLGPIAFGLNPTESFLSAESLIMEHLQDRVANETKMLPFWNYCRLCHTCYIATLGSVSGFRTMAAARFT